jgi:hypothetical protein
MAITRIDFTEWLPDQPGVVGALTNALNVFPKAIGYGPFPNEEDYSNAATEDLNSVSADKDNAGVVRLFAGSATKLWLFNSSNNNLDDVSGATYTSTDKWRFLRFGDYFIASNNKNKLQYYDLTTTGDFADLDASAPTAKLITVVRDFVVVGNTTSASDEVRWSGINNPTTWASSAVTQSDFQRIPDGGQVRGLTGGEFGLVLLEKSIVRMSYVGTPLIFQFDNISRNLGCYESNSVAQWKGVTYFLADDGFYSCDGQNLEAIGAEKINRFFWSSLREEVISQMSTAVDPFRSLVIWGYPTDEGYRLLVYHTQTKRWSYVDTNVNRISDVFTPSTSLEALDNFSSSLDNLTASLDSRQWVGGKLLLSGVRGGKVINFVGANKQARITTPDVQGGDSMSMVTLVKPIIDAGSASMSVASRMNLAQAVAFGTSSAADAENRAGFRSLGRYHRIRVEPSGNWTTAIGLEAEVQPAGMR